MEFSFIENAVSKGIYYLYIFKLIIGIEDVLRSKLIQKGVSESNIVFFMVLSMIVIFTLVLVSNYYIKKYLTNVIEKYVPKSLVANVLSLFLGTTLISLIVRFFSTVIRIL